MIRVLLIDSNPQLLVYTREILENSREIKVIAETSYPFPAIQYALDLKPEIIIIGLQIFQMEKIELIWHLKKLIPESKILVLYLGLQDIFPSRILSSSADGYLGLYADSPEIINAVKKIHSGVSFISEEIQQYLGLIKYDHEQDYLLKNLSNQELEVLILLAKGFTLKEIATSLFINTKKVNIYRSHILQKLGVTKDMALLRLAIQHHWITVDYDWHHNLGRKKHR